MEDKKPGFEMFAKTFQGMENILAQELTEFGATEVTLLRRAVSFTGDLELMYKLNLWSRLALRIYKPLFKYKVINDKDLYEGARNFDWGKIFDTDQSFAIEAVLIPTPNFNHSGYVGLRVKDAIVDYFRDKTGRRPNVDTKNPQIQLYVHLSSDICTISLDASGEPLFKRGYRQAKGAAPMNEVLAAGILKLTGWKPEQTLIDPMCGAGTLPIEAALIALGLPPNILRRRFGFQDWYDYNPELWQNIQSEAKSISRTRKLPARIIAADQDESALKAFKENVSMLGLDIHFDIQRKKFQEFNPGVSNAVVVINPPYGERLKVEDLQGLYKEMGDTLKKSYQGCVTWIISSNKEALKFVGLHPSKKIDLFNGPLECKLQRYELYQGSLKQKFNEKNS